MLTACIIDYNVGNLFSMKNALKKIGLKVEISSDPKTIMESNAVILPGVGNFGPASNNLAHLKDTIIDYVKHNRPLLGSCLGMQLLLNESEEGNGEGLKLIEGKVKKFGSNVKIPHMGWNNIIIENNNDILDGLNEKSYFYFVHSYYPVIKNSTQIVACTCHGIKFPSIVSKQNVYGCQFHPEKSGEDGLKILKNFARMAKK
ncbi:imidazole glycerol phosphate synthase subunit HisH [Candidatus Bathyarchaeota archaeon]|nr:imidazole glycerol phosphate synthase subunit HisH [Candidatus Bathyarchaeota archaeon]